MRLISTSDIEEPKDYKFLMTPLWANVFYPGTLNLLTAPMKAGKSSFLYGWAKEMVRGTAWGGIAPAKPLKIAYYDLENPDAIQYAKFQNSKHPDFKVTQGAWLEDFTIHGIEKNWIETGWFPDVVIVEPLVFAINIRNENDNNEMKNALKPFLKFARIGKLCIILVHHNRKPSAENPMDLPKYSARGAGSLGGIIDVQLNIVEGQTRRWVQVTMNRYGAGDNGSDLYEPRFILHYDNETKLSSGERVLY